jgi:hypothetical protein
MSLNNRRPCPNCPLPCAFHDSPMCVTNVINLNEQNAQISFGLHIGLNHIYGGSPLPPCVRGNLGSAYWSIAEDDNPAAQLPPASRVQMASA